MRLDDLSILFPERINSFQQKAPINEIYLQLLFFSHIKDDVYKPILQYVNAISTSVYLDYSALKDVDEINHKKIYESLYVFDTFSALINNFIFSIKYLKQPYEINNAVETLYEKMELLRPYINRFVITDIANITLAKLAENAQKEIIKRVILIHKLINSFKIDVNLSLFDIKDIDYHKLTSRYILDGFTLSLFDRHIKCTPKQAFEIINSNIQFFKTIPEFEPFNNYCFVHTSKFLQEIAGLGKNKRIYLGINHNFPTQPLTGYFINELDTEDRREFFKYIHSPEPAPSFKLYNPKVDEFNLLPFLVVALAPRNDSGFFSAPFVFFGEHNTRFSFYLQGLIDSYIPVSKENNPSLYFETIKELGAIRTNKVSKLQQLKKLTNYISYDITLNINRLLFSQTPNEYQRNLLALHESFVSLEIYFDCYALSENEIIECNFSDHETSIISDYQDMMIRFFAYVSKTSEDIYGGEFSKFRPLSQKEMAYWKFIYICLAQPSDINIPESLAILTLKEFCDLIEQSYNNFINEVSVGKAFVISLDEAIKEQITHLIARYCLFYDKAGFFQSLFEVTQRHLLLEDKAKLVATTSPIPNNKQDQFQSILDSIFKNK